MRRPTRSHQTLLSKPNRAMKVCLSLTLTLQRATRSESRRRLIEPFQGFQFVNRNGRSPRIRPGRAPSRPSRHPPSARVDLVDDQQIGAGDPGRLARDFVPGGYIGYVDAGVGEIGLNVGRRGCRADSMKMISSAPSLSSIFFTRLNSPSRLAIAVCGAAAGLDRRRSARGSARRSARGSRSPPRVDVIGDHGEPV